MGMKCFLGKPFKEVAEILNNQRNHKNPVILVGVKRANRVLLNPREGEFDVFKKDDYLIVMSFEKPDLRYLENM